MILIGKQAGAGNASLKLFRSELENRKDLWFKAGKEKQKTWLEKDPVLKTAYEVYQYLDRNFFRGYNE